MRISDWSSDVCSSDLLALGGLLGFLAAARPGWTEERVMRCADFTFAFPAVLSAIMLAAVFGPGTLNSVIAIGIFNIPVFARVVRASANAIWTRDYVLAARAAGTGSFRITLEHVLPNILSAIVGQAHIDRKSVGWGKGGTVHVELGG